MAQASKNPRVYPLFFGVVFASSSRDNLGPFRDFGDAIIRQLERENQHRHSYIQKKRVEMAPPPKHQNVYPSALFFDVRPDKPRPLTIVDLVAGFSQVMDWVF